MAVLTPEPSGVLIAAPDVEEEHGGSERVVELCEGPANEVVDTASVSSPRILRVKTKPCFLYFSLFFISFFFQFLIFQFLHLFFIF